MIEFKDLDGLPCFVRKDHIVSISKECLNEPTWIMYCIGDVHVRLDETTALALSQSLKDKYTYCPGSSGPR